ncbi:hypothetical protein OG205_15180 [Lentzea sp. NBC_00516]|uniref:hypothetical protein n=1 Tax=Lentzea sp. NBC_00516 TaxID=2903582 RepID=UPI002E81B8EA|nr:hypothetical protein [Lentzea sp. NBC_00516]WUD28290.1 hypothetical protein OG205_15180 [Lentzea sp. NBC_00516]
MTKVVPGAGLAAGALTVAANPPVTAEVNESQAFTGWSYEHTPEEAVREALDMARRRAMIAGFDSDECVLLFVNATRLGPGCYAGDAGLRCAR